MSKAVFTEASFNDVKGYTISLDIKPEGEIGLVSVEYDTRNLRAELVNEEAGSVSGYLVGVRSEGSIISFDVLARDIKDLGRYSVVVNYDLVLVNGKTKAITIEEYVFEAVRIEEKPALGGGLAVHTVVRGITSGTGATSESAEGGATEELSRKLEALTQEIQTLKQKAESTPKAQKLMSYNEVMALVEKRQDETYRQIVDDTETFPPGTFRRIYHKRLSEICMTYRTTESDSRYYPHGLTRSLGMLRLLRDVIDWSRAKVREGYLPKPASTIFSDFLKFESSKRAFDANGSQVKEALENLMRLDGYPFTPFEHTPELTFDGSLQLSQLNDTDEQALTKSLERLLKAYVLYAIEDPIGALQLQNLWDIQIPE